MTDNDLGLRHLLGLDRLTREQLIALLDRAQAFVARPGEKPVTNNSLQGRTVANLFFEPSTRTRASFELAARRLGAEVLNLDMATASTAKGETELDTVKTLQAMNVDLFVIRHAVDGMQDKLANAVDDHVSIVNAGSGHTQHPTQGLLDLLTIRQHKPDFNKLHIAIVGDIRHSRVARSAIHGLSLLGVGDLRLVGPENLLPPADEKLPGEPYTDMDAGIRGCDVVMMLRIQKERMQANDIPDDASYHARYGLTEERLALLADDPLVMHPGPMNRGVEIADSVADGPHSVILEQVNNGVAARMAVLATLLGT
jgi:aspartate carbamoyltransferase catalytic subunit